MRQISGAIARRIVCDLRPGEVLAAGAEFGMIKLGSRTELILPAEDGLEVEGPRRAEGEGRDDGHGGVQGKLGLRTQNG